MGLFSSKPKPKISVEGIEITFNSKSDIWEFKYRGTEFCDFDSIATLPAKAELDVILETVEALKPEMKSRLKQWVAVGDGESYFVEVKDFAKEKTFVVTWSEGASWGDMGVDFTIKDSAIIEESCGD